MLLTTVGFTHRLHFNISWLSVDIVSISTQHGVHCNLKQLQNQLSSSIDTVHNVALYRLIWSSTNLYQIKL